MSIRLAADPDADRGQLQAACLRRLAIFAMVARVAAAPGWNGTCINRLLLISD